MSIKGLPLRCKTDFNDNKYGQKPSAVSVRIASNPNSLSLFIAYSELFTKPLDNGCLVDIQGQVSLLVPYHLCCDIIG